jgi:hypothetical protein
VKRILHRTRKNQAISLRLPKEDLELTKKRAAEAGLPAQTLISSIIHKYVTDQLYERDEVRKIVRELEEERTSAKQGVPATGNVSGRTVAGSRSTT